ncbi:TonB-dependent receptor SusC [termite gut metagenome]|uniref:TonB-dependent receptor SusC n=1 Tax=termite gut metagenome TaxID=433724 RepID=A0A5J4RRW3_9ZZZZ
MKLIRQLVERQKYRHALFIFLAVLGMQTLFAQSLQEEKVTLNVQNQPLEKVIGTLTQQTGLKFFYSEITIAGKVVSLDFSNTAINTVLAAITRQTQLNFTRENNTITINTQAIASETTLQKGEARRVTGTVTDPNGEPIIGANVTANGTTHGVITDFNGKFALNVPENTLLMVSYIGYHSQEVAIGNRVTLQITLLESSLGLDEVVVVGYGTVRKRDLTGSVGSVSSDNVLAKGTSSVLGALQGSIPGVNITTASVRPGGGFDIEIRGQNSLQKGSPLYVVDGIVTNDIDFLNPSDIERIDILKDASSAAIYGSRGSNGVVIIQTKSAESVVIGAKTIVSYDGYYGVRAVSRIPEFMDGREWIDFRTTAYYTWNNGLGNFELSNANRDAVTLASPIIDQRLYEENYEDWLGQVTRTGRQQNHYLNVKGSEKNIAYNIGIGLQNEEGNFINEDFNRYNMKLSIEHKSSKYFRIGGSANLSYSTSNAGSQLGYRDAAIMPSILRARDADGNLIPQPGLNSVVQSPLGANFTGVANPLIEVASGKQETNRYDVMGNIYAQITPIEGLDIKTTLAPRFNKNRFGTYLGRVKGSNAAPRSDGIDYASTNNQETFDYTWDNQITYDIKWNQHHFNVMALNSFYNTRYEQTAIAALDFPYPADWYNIYSGKLVESDCSSAYHEASMISFAGRINYDYMGKYLATATVRYDGSSKLADKWKAFPSFSLAWRLSEEGFMKNATWLTNLKTRFSFGYSGNNNGVNPYGTMNTPVTSSKIFYDYNGEAISGFAPGSPVNSSLTWEKTRELNFGIDYGFFKGRVSGAIDLYDKLSDGLLMSRRLAVESGVESMIDNIGSVNNRGIELTLSTVNVNTKDWRWTTSFSFAHNVNAIKSLYGKKEDVIGEQRFIGKSIQSIYDYQILGVWTVADYETGKTVYYGKDGSAGYKGKPGEGITYDADGDGKLGPEDKVILGSSDPDWTGSFVTTLNYKGWDLSVDLYAKMGVFVYDEFLAQYGYNSQRGMQKVKMDYYAPPGVPTIDWDNFTVTDGKASVNWKTAEGHENAKYPLYKNNGGAYYGDNNAQSYANGHYQDASFAKIKNITLGYTFDKAISQKLKMSQLRLYANILNPFVFTEYIGWDPEYATTKLVDGNGPSNTTYQFGVNIKF